MKRMHQTTFAALLVCLLSRSSLAFTTTTSTFRPVATLGSSLHGTSETVEDHPAVLGWPGKYSDAGGVGAGPRPISTQFDVHEANESELKDLYVEHWPTWTTGDKPKWDVGNQVANKEMPYGELSYMISGKLEIIPQSTGVPVIVNKGDLVTFPKGFVASWKVLEELTWHYYLY